MGAGTPVSRRCQEGVWKQAPLWKLYILSREFSAFIHFNETLSLIGVSVFFAVFGVNKLPRYYIDRVFAVTAFKLTGELHAGCFYIFVFKNKVVIINRFINNFLTFPVGKNSVVLTVLCNRMTQIFLAASGLLADLQDYLAVFFTFTYRKLHYFTSLNTAYSESNIEFTKF